ncbi:lipase prepro protein [Sporodiniella umbellata]|nr:lipase prepro protein [Sporodiniella umbellata]
MGLESIPVGEGKVDRFEFPPLISSRCLPAAEVRGVDSNSETRNMESNKAWYSSHGGNMTFLARAEPAAEPTTAGGMTLDVPNDAPSIVVSMENSEVVPDYIRGATAEQINNLKYHAGIASTAYRTSVLSGKNWNCSECLSQVPDGSLISVFNSTAADAHGYVMRSDARKAIYLVFRGTSSFRGAVTDMLFMLTEYAPVPGAMVHTGFYSSYGQVVYDYYPILQSQVYAYPDYKVVMLGHSLGAAQALLAGLDLYQREPTISAENLSIYLLGGPRVGNPAFAYYVNSTGIPVLRTVNKRDIVPHVPPMAFGFLHPGVEYWIQPDAQHVQICTSNIETPYCSNTIVPFTSLADHLLYFDFQEHTCPEC